jgi:HAD superfamily hydrolase (TIGR01509 family)
MSRLLLLDLDNTLADREAGVRVWAGAAAAIWAPNDDDAAAWLIEEDRDGFRSRTDLFTAVKGRFALIEPVNDLVAEFRRSLRGVLPPIDPEVVRRLGELRGAGWKLGVVTNGEAAGQTAKLERLGVFELVDACCISGELGIRKPDPRIFEIAAQRCGAALENAWMIGDSPADIEGARNAGIRSIWLSRGRSWEDRGYAPDRVADSLVDALDLI